MSKAIPQSMWNNEQHPLQVTSVDRKSIDELREQISEITGRVKAREAHLVLSATLATNAFPCEGIYCLSLNI
jgi:hypothetical protein